MSTITKKFDEWHVESLRFPSLFVTLFLGIIQRLFYILKMLFFFENVSSIHFRGRDLTRLTFSLLIGNLDTTTCLMMMFEVSNLTFILNHPCFSILGFHQSVIKTKNRNQSMNKVKNLGYDRWLIYKQPRQKSGLCCFSFPRYLQ